MKRLSAAKTKDSLRSRAACQISTSSIKYFRLPDKPKESQMGDKFLALVLYPALADGLSKDEQEALKHLIEGMGDVDPSQLIEVLLQRVTRRQMSDLASQVPEDQKTHYYSLAYQIASVNGLSKSEKAALQELAAALKIPEDIIGFDIPKADFDINLPEENFLVIARGFSMLAAVIGFLPTPFISDFTILALLQIYMVNKIAHLYNYPLNAKELVKMVSGTVGLGYVCAVTARGLLALVPLGGWVVAGGISFAGTYAIAIIAQQYIEHNGELSKESIKIIYKDAYEEGKKQFKLLKNDILLEKDSLLQELKKIAKKK
jgi:uncharacterized protein (DUF697 family)